MDNIRRLRIILFVILLVSGIAVSNPVVAQITSTGYNSVIETGYSIEYPDTVFKESIYVFCGDLGNLSASLPDIPGNFRFEWSAYDPGIPGFGEPFNTIEDVPDSQITGLSTGGYRVRITNGNGLDSLLRAWIFVNSPSPQTDVVRHDCEVLDLDAVAGIDTFYYYHPVTDEKYNLPADISFSWQASPGIATAIPNRLNPRIWNPPPVETEYTFTVNYYSCVAETGITEEPVTTRAGLSLDPSEGEAPLEVSFSAESSVNAQVYQWFFDYRASPLEIQLPDDFTPDPMHVYFIPGEYTVKLRTISPFLCEDSLVFQQPVKVYPSELEVPNVFTPDGDEFNNVFMVRAVSMRSFSAMVFNRNGRKVHEWTDPSEGWDGRIDGGSLASPGVYYYIIAGEGWDDKKYEFTGPLYLYRAR